MDKIEYLRSMNVDVDQGIQNMMDVQTYDEMLGDFYDSIPEELGKINNFKNIGDMPNYAILVHALKSNARSFGFMKLGDICYAHELASKASDVTYVNLHYDELLQAIKDTVNIITKYKTM